MTEKLTLQQAMLVQNGIDIPKWEILTKETRKSVPLSLMLSVLGIDEPKLALESWLKNDEIESFDQKDITDGFIPYLRKNEDELSLEKIKAFEQILLYMKGVNLDFIIV